MIKQLTFTLTSDSFLADFFRGPVVSQVRLAGLEHVIMVTATGGKILLRNYRCVSDVLCNEW